MGWSYNTEERWEKERAGRKEKRGVEREREKERKKRERERETRKRKERSEIDRQRERKKDKESSPWLGNKELFNSRHKFFSQK